jgi:branched-chain amino acid transport system ATP-binding protein
MNSGEEALVVEDAVLRFRGIVAVDSVSFEVGAGTTFGVIGPNGAGKTALLNCISGIYRLDQGSILLYGQQIQHHQPHRITALGLSRTFQSTEHFREFTVRDYVMLGRAQQARCSVLGSLLLWPIAERAERAERQRAMAVLDRLGLVEFATERLSDLPYGVQKRVDIARAVAAEPKIMLMDEPTSGTTTSERDAVSHTIRTVAATGVTIVVIDHDVDFVTRHCDRVLVVNYGRAIGVGTPKEMLGRPEVVEAFLGTPVGHSA